MSPAVLRVGALADLASAFSHTDIGLLVRCGGGNGFDIVFGIGMFESSENNPEDMNSEHCTKMFGKAIPNIAKYGTNGSLFL